MSLIDDFSAASPEDRQAIFALLAPNLAAQNAALGRAAQIAAVQAASNDALNALRTTATNLDAAGDLRQFTEDELATARVASAQPAQLKTP